MRYNFDYCLLYIRVIMLRSLNFSFYSTRTENNASNFAIKYTNVVTAK